MKWPSPLTLKLLSKLKLTFHSEINIPMYVPKYYSETSQQGPSEEQLPSKQQRHWLEWNVIPNEYLKPPKRGQPLNKGQTGHPQWTLLFGGFTVCSNPLGKGLPNSTISSTFHAHEHFLAFLPGFNG